MLSHTHTHTHTHTDTQIGQRLQRLFGGKPDRHGAQSYDHAECEEHDSSCDEFGYIGIKKKEVISGSMLHIPPGFDMAQYTTDALSSNGLRKMFDGWLAAFPRTNLRILLDNN